MEKSKKRKKLKRKLDATLSNDVAKTIAESPEVFDNDPNKRREDTSEASTTEQQSTSLETSPPSTPKLKKDTLAPASTSKEFEEKPEFVPLSDIHKFPLPRAKEKKKQRSKKSSSQETPEPRKLRCPDRVTDVLIHANRVLRAFSAAERDDLELLIHLEREHGWPKVVLGLGKPC